MGSTVFANGREISCKSGAGKSICAFPDVCMTPPENPATPPGVPIPYPNTAMDTDTADGSKKVKIKKKEVGIKDSSNIKKSTGDEAGSAAKKGLLSSKNTGKVYFKSWSSDVKIEGENAVRHLDITTHNHGSANANEAVPWPIVSRMVVSNQKQKPCASSCPKKPSKSDYSKVRRKSPSKEAKKKVNEKTPKKCASCGGSPANLAADHIVPLKIISQMPGFSCLSEENQEKIANTESNYVGLCTSCNSSKSAKLWHKWTEVKSRSLKLDANLRKKAMKLTGDLIFNIKSTIKSLPCG